MTVARRLLLKGRHILAFVPLEETKQAGLGPGDLERKGKDFDDKSRPLGLYTS